MTEEEILEFRRHIESHQEKFLKEFLPKAHTTYQDIFNPENKESNLKLKLDASRDVYRASGVLPGPEQSIKVKQIFNQNNFILPPVVRDLIGSHVKKLTGGYVDAEVEDAEET